MLAEVRIDDVVVIEQAQVEWHEGFTVLTGETGAGKSVCVAALRAAVGGRADAGLIRPGAERARVTAVFGRPGAAVMERLEALGIPGDGDLVTLSREVAREGRGRCRVNGSLVSQAALRDIGDQLIEVTAQGESVRLMRRSWQRDLLDDVGGAAVAGLRSDCRAAVTRWRDAETRLNDVRAMEAAGEQQLEAARQVLEDLQPLDLRPGEEERLVEERVRLRQADAIVAAAAALHGACSGGDESLGAVTALGAARNDLERLAGPLPEVAALVGQADAAVELLGDLSRCARTLADSVVSDPRRLEAVEERLDVLARVRRRFGSVEEAAERLANARALLEGAAGVADHAELERAVARARGNAATAALALSVARTRAARTLERRCLDLLRQLDLPHARFRIVLDRVGDADGLEVDGSRLRCTADGIDEVDFRFAANPDSLPVPLADGPSGGELSRLALALRALASSSDSATLVLDEVDTGIGGETAARVGELLAQIGGHRQVIAVTHRAEIAARADNHLVATKICAQGVTRSDVVACRGSARIDEVARMMSGRLTAAARQRAAELVNEGAGAPVQRRRRGA